MPSSPDTPQTAVAQYYMSIHFGVVAGKVDAFNRVDINDKVAWSGTITSEQAVTIDLPSLFGGIKEQGGVGGVIEFYMGDEYQSVSRALAARLGSTTQYTTSDAVTSGVAGSYELTCTDVTNLTKGHGIGVADLGSGHGTGAITAGTKVLSVEGNIINIDKPVVTTFAPDGSTGTYPQLFWAVSVDGIGNTPATVPGFRGLASLFFHSGTPTVTRTIWEKTLAYLGGSGDGYDTASGDGPSGSVPPPASPDYLYHGGFYWIANYPTVPKVASVQTRYPVGPNGDKYRNPDGGANPAHMIWECLTNLDWGLGAPVGLIDVASFQAAAAVLNAEQFNLSMLWVRSEYVENFISEILGHIQAVLSVAPASGRLTIKLLRNDYNTEELFIVHPGNAHITSWQRKAWGEAGNEVVVTYTDSTTFEPITVTAQDNGLIAIQGAVISTARSYPGITNGRLAVKAAQRDLRQSATPLLAVDLEIDRTAWKQVVGGVMELRWPEYGVASMWIRILSVNYGRPGDSTIKISALEDIFGYGAAIYTDLPADNPDAPPPRDTPPDAPVFVAPPPVPAYEPPEPEGGRGVLDEVARTLDHLYLGDALYYAINNAVGDDAMAGFSYPQSVDMVLTAQNSVATSVIGMWVERADSTGAITYVNSQQRPNMCHGYLSAALVREEESTFAALDTRSGSPVTGGYLMMLVDPTNPAIQEICVIDTVADDLTFTAWRGVLDTYPRAWPIGTEVWVFRNGFTSFDNTIRPVGSVAHYKFTPKTAAGMLPLASASAKTMTVDERIYQPYRPANVVVAGELWNVPAPAQGDVVVTFNRRNRVNETARILKWTDIDVPPESNQTTVISICRSTGFEVARHTGIAGTTFTIPEADLLLTGGPTALIMVGSERYDVSLAATFPSFRMVERTIDLSSWTFSGYGKDYGVRYGV